MKRKKIFFSVPAITLALGLVLAACGSKDPLEGKWTTTVDGDPVTVLFYGGQVGVDGLGSRMTPYTFEKNTGTITDYGLSFTLSGKTVKITVLGRDLTVTRDTKPPTPKALAGEWIADDGKLSFINDLYIVTNKNGDARFGSYTFADNQGEFDSLPGFGDVSFTVNGKTLTVAPESEEYKMVFTQGGKK
jgi:hypothetical protein